MQRIHLFRARDDFEVATDDHRADTVQVVAVLPEAHEKLVPGEIELLLNHSVANESLA